MSRGYTISISPKMYYIAQNLSNSSIFAQFNKANGANGGRTTNSSELPWIAEIYLGLLQITQFSTNIDRFSTICREGDHKLNQTRLSIQKISLDKL